MVYGAVYDWFVRRVTSSLTRPDHHIDLMSQSYRRQKPTNSVRRGLLAKLSQFKAPTDEIAIHGGRAYDARCWSAADRRRYAEGCAAVRAAYGLTDGLKLNQSDFNAYLARRRAEDKQRRGW